MTKAVEGLVEALRAWKCIACDAYRTCGVNPECGFCGSTGLHPVARAALEAFAAREPLRDDADFVCGVLEAYGWHAMAHGPLCDVIEEHVFGPRGAGNGEG